MVITGINIRKSKLLYNVLVKIIKASRLSSIKTSRTFLASNRNSYENAWTSQSTRFVPADVNWRIRRILPYRMSLQVIRCGCRGSTGGPAKYPHSVPVLASHSACVPQTYIHMFMLRSSTKKRTKYMQKVRRQRRTSANHRFKDRSRAQAYNFVKRSSVQIQNL